MVFQRCNVLIIFLLFSLSLTAQKFNFKNVLATQPLQNSPFAVEYNHKNLEFLHKENIPVKQITKDWIYITCTPEWISEQKQKGKISDFYFEFAPPSLLSDSSRYNQNVDPVHQGAYPLPDKYTGKGVILGLVDSGLDYRHPDFIDEFGLNRVIRYWNQQDNHPTSSPQPYGYGQIWYEEDIQNATYIPANGDSGHGTTVTGNSAGNGRANGRNKGMAPDVKIVFVETNFRLSNWTLSVADACDYIFKVADSLNMPAVINLSVGSYLGSHDGNDPAGVLMAQLVNEKPGRIIVGAAGNGDGYENYHAQQIINELDTNFIWLENNPTGQLGDNTAFFDLWSDINEAQFYYAFGANDPNKGYRDVGSTVYRFAQVNVGTPIFDTLRNAAGDQIATLEIYTEYNSGSYHMQGFFSQVDSTNYFLRFSVTGQGKYDLWSGEWMDLNKLVVNVPDETVYPDIVYYTHPDKFQSIVSSWNCHEDIISVANMKNRDGFLTYNGTYNQSGDPVAVGEKSTSSSIGPTRKGTIKPEISASGDYTLSSAPLFIVENSSWANSLDELGYHVLNGGTSMASPVVAGIAALYLERCPNSTVQEFIEDLHATALQDIYTGTIPNPEYGYGKIDALALLSAKNNTLQILGDDIVCQMPVELKSNIPLMSYEWSNGSSDSKIYVGQPETISLIGRDLQGCKIYSDTLEVMQGSALPNPTIAIIGDSLISSEAPNYQWYLNDSPISGATKQVYYPTTNGFYSVAIQGEDNNCKSFSNAVQWFLGLEEEQKNTLRIYPNPAHDILYISGDEKLSSAQIYTIEGRLIQTVALQDKETIEVSFLSKGSYLLKIKTQTREQVFPFLKH